MAQRSIQGDQELGRKIKHRRNELNLTIEEAASRAGVGTKLGVATKRANPFVGTNAREFAKH